ncbi:helix-turn-helix domain-containing protein [Lutimonas halocynthiae]|uniref:helix-turn-helix domain-containing protein n=1 Tax=Lutimonas halocynthiae TaxID=1446477 RepID=UPI00338F8710
MHYQKDLQKEYLNTQECMLLLDISRTTLWELRREGRIPFIRLRNKILYSRQAIEESLTKINYTK